MLRSNLPRRAFFLHYIEMEEGRGQTDSQVHRSHLILLHGGDVAQETQQGLQNLPVLIRHQHDGCLHRLQPLLLGHVWGKARHVQEVSCEPGTRQSWHRHSHSGNSSLKRQMTGDKWVKTSWWLEGRCTWSSIEHGSPSQCVTFLCSFERLLPKNETELHLKFMKGE